MQTAFNWARKHSMEIDGFNIHILVEILGARFIYSILNYTWNYLLNWCVGSPKQPVATNSDPISFYIV